MHAEPQDEQGEDDDCGEDVFVGGDAEWNAMRAHPLAKHVAEVHIARISARGAKVCTQKANHHLLQATSFAALNEVCCVTYLSTSCKVRNMYTSPQALSKSCCST